MSSKEHRPQPPSILRQHSNTNSPCASPSSFLGLNKPPSPRATPKSVSISNQPEVMSPLILGTQKNVDDLDLSSAGSRRKLSIKRASSRRLAGRLGVNGSSFKTDSDANASSETHEEREPSHRVRSRHRLEHLIDHVSEWIKDERLKRASKRHELKPKTHNETDSHGWNTENDEDSGSSVKRKGSEASDDSFDLDKLEGIIRHNLSIDRRSMHSSNRSPNDSRKNSLKYFGRKQSTASSDTDHLDNEIDVPTCDAILDNSKTIAYTGGASDASDDASSDDLRRTASYKDRGEWAKFKFEIVRLTHTLRLRGWRRVPLAMCNKITVERLSGALTNAVYVVSPPAGLPQRHYDDSSSVTLDKAGKNGKNGQTLVSAPKQSPPKLLLRIYGAQVDHLIDRESELAILRRLAKQKIGPRLLGCFTNGRFEEYLYAKPLTPKDLCNPDTSRQIAKRMRELHDGIELLKEERDGGPFVWQNWDKWVNRVEQIVSWLDCQVFKLDPNAKPTGAEAWKRRGYICGVPWKQFRQMVEKYRSWLNDQYGDAKVIREQLVFAHNDAQYGNILRLVPTGESPLLLPANTHKQLIVIDFEYSRQNLVGLEFANHFTEWCYNYHDTKKPYAFHPKLYPTPEEQEGFLRAYVRHRPQFNISTPKLMPNTPPTSSDVPGDDPPSRRPTTSISEFMLDARAPSTMSLTQDDEEVARRSEEDKEVARLAHETRLWRLANTAQWVAWGLVQAKVPGMPDFSPTSPLEPGSGSEEDLASQYLDERAGESKESDGRQQSGQSVNESEAEEVDEEFDYLGYAQHRALFFWADAIQLGLAKAEDLPRELREKVKFVPY